MPRLSRCAYCIAAAALNDGTCVHVGLENIWRLEKGRQNVQAHRCFEPVLPVSDVISLPPDIASATPGTAVVAPCQRSCSCTPIEIVLFVCTGRRVHA